LAGNQIIIAGSATYEFNHFYKYYSYYKEIILSGGDKVLLKQKFPEMNLPDEVIDISQYAIMRIPAEILPPGMMDKKVLAQGQATMDPQIFSQEYGAVFCRDSEGFFLASALHRATCPIASDRHGVIDFGPRLYGDSEKQYVMGVDPASEDDNFAIGIMELNATHNGYVYQWTTNRKDFEELKRNKWVEEDIKDYNSFCIRHIRKLLRRFNIVAMFVDAGGGGLSVREGLRDEAKLLDSADQLIYDMDDENVQGLQGRHILKMIAFQSYEWRVNSHYKLKRDILDLWTLFPKYDPAEVEVAANAATKAGQYFDTLEDCYLELEQCKQETVLIKHTATATGQEKWDVPDIVGVDAEQVRKQLKRDRFTSLLLANDAAKWYREENELGQPKTFNVAGNGVIHNIAFTGKNIGRMRPMPTIRL